MEEYGVNLIVGLVQDSINRGTATEETGPNASRNALQSVTLLETIDRENFDACLGGRSGMRRSRAKEVFFTVIRSANGIPRIKDPSYGIFSMGVRQVKTSGFSPK